jgi:hypothetical protein
MDVIKKQFLDKNRMIGYIGSILLIIGNFLPFYKVDVIFASKTMSYIQGDGMFVLILGVVAAALIYFDKRMLSIIPAAVSLLILVLFMTNLNKYGLSGIGSLQFGFYVLVIGAGLVIFNALRKQA